MKIVGVSRMTITLTEQQRMNLLTCVLAWSPDERVSEAYTNLAEDLDPQAVRELAHLLLAVAK